MSRFAGLPAALKATKASSEAPEDIEDIEDEGDGSPPPAKSKKKEPVMADETQTAAALDAAKKEGHDAGFKAATDRFNAVMASEHYAGREASAAKLLTNGALFSASADDVWAILADMPKVEQTALTEEDQRAAAEEGGRKEMKEVLGKSANSNIDANAGKAKAETPAAVWDSAIASVCPGARN